MKGQLRFPLRGATFIGASQLQSHHGRAPSALTVHILALEDKDAFCSRVKLKLAPE